MTSLAAAKAILVNGMLSIKKENKLNTHFGKLKITMAHYQSSTGWR